MNFNPPITSCSWSELVEFGECTDGWLVHSLTEGPQVFMRITFKDESQECRVTDLLMRAQWKRLKRRQKGGVITVEYGR